MTTIATAAAALKVEHLPITAIHPDPENARLHSKRQIRAIARSIEAFRFNVPVLADAGGKIVAGHGRYEAAKLLRQDTVPVIRLEHLTPAQARAFAIADNKLTDSSEFDPERLAIHLKELSALELDFSLEATGFSTGEIDLLIEGLGVAPADDVDPDDQPIEPAPAVAKRGDRWILGDHAVVCGDALSGDDYRLLLGADHADWVFSDLPYNVQIDGHVSGKGKRRHREFAMAAGEMSEGEFVAFLTQAIGRLVEFSNDGSVHYLCMDWRHIHALLAAGRSAYGDLLNICVWTKNNGGMGSLYRSAHEFVAVFRNGRGAHRNNVELGRHGRNRTNVWAYPGANTFLRAAEDGDLMAQHPTPKPVRLVVDALLDTSGRGDLVLDPFLGSGATLIAAERTGRRCRGIEIDPLYVDLAVRRWQRHTGEDARLSSTGQTFDALSSGERRR